jgi:hypothetical protein
MPYEGELASKVAHSDMLKNPEIQDFLAGCEYLRIPSEEEGQALADRFRVAPTTDNIALPDNIIAVDGSRYESAIHDQLPSTRVGYVKVSAMLILMSAFQSLRVMDGRFVDPFRVARLQDSNTALTFPVPSANIRWQGNASVRDSFRAAVDAQLYSKSKRINPNDPSTSLRTTLFHLASRRRGELGTGDPSRLILHACPTCGREHIELLDQPAVQHCPACGSEVFPADCLRIWELVAENQSNVAALTRFMSLVEHLLIIHYIRYLADASLPVLARTAFFLDDPLAIFGNAAWMHASIMRFLDETNRKLSARGFPNVLLIGLQKTGQVVDHVALIDKYIPLDRIFAIDDEYRYEYILSMREPASQGFGYEIYYGQDFIYKTSSGRTFVCAVPYPFATKRPPGIDFIQAKADIANYPDLPRALALIRHFESDLYANAVVPIALAHKYTAISLVPGGQALDILTRKALNGP